MLTPEILDTFAGLDTDRQVAVLRNHQLLDTDPGDAVMGHLAGHHPEQFSALLAALQRADV